MTEPLRSGFAALVGKTNVGKSTLINALIGSKISIVTAKPQTTRHRIVGVLNGPGAQLVLLDTPGVHEPRHQLDKALLTTATRALPDAELIVLVVEVTSPPQREDEQAARLLRAEPAPVILALNKQDLVSAAELKQRRAEYSALVDAEECVPLSALTGDGVPALKEALLSRLPEGPLYYPADATTDQVEDLLVAERIRECVLTMLHQEVPYSVAVTVDQIEPRPNDRLYIHANLYVERESQKRILIGRGGASLKAIGSAARKSLEPLFKQPLYLDLWVRVLPKWRKNERALRRLGYLETGD